MMINDFEQIEEEEAFSHPSTVSFRSPRRRVLHVTETYGGVLRHLVDVVRTVKNVEHHVALPRRDSGHDARLDPGPDPLLSTGQNPRLSLVNGMSIHDLVDAGATIHRIHMTRNVLDPRNPVGVLELRRLGARLNPAVVHGHSSVGGAFVRAANLGRQTPVVYTPSRWSRHLAIHPLHRAAAGAAARIGSLLCLPARALDWFRKGWDLAIELPSSPMALTLRSTAQCPSTFAPASTYPPTRRLSARWLVSSLRRHRSTSCACVPKC